MAKIEKKEIIRMIKYLCFAASAGIIQMATFALLNNVLFPRLPENIQAWSILGYLPFDATLKYGLGYIIAQTVSVIWNFSVNRKFTFQSAANVKSAMAKVLAFHLVVQPISMIAGTLVTKSLMTNYPNIPVDFVGFLVLIPTMILNTFLEYAYQYVFVYRGKKDNNNLTQKEKQENT